MARVAHRLGGDVTAIYPIGGQIGKLLQRLVEREDIASIVTPSHVEMRENFTAYEETTGEQYRFVLPAHHCIAPNGRRRSNGWRLWRNGRNTSSPAAACRPGAPDDFFARMARHGKALGARTVIDASGAALAAVLQEGVTVIKPNLIELMEFVAAPLAHDEDRMTACRKLAAGGGAEIVALTLGEHGALPLAIEAVSTVGAGDSFLGGLVAELSAGKPLDEAFRVAVAAASAAVMMPGTGLCQPEDVKRLLPKVRIEEIARVPA